MYEIQKISDKKMIVFNQNFKEKNFWLKKLSGLPEKSCFPRSHKKISPGKQLPGTIKFRFSGEPFVKLIEISNNSDVRLHILLTTGLCLLLHKYTGNKDIIVGSPIYRQEVEADFINTVLVLRNFIEDNMTVKELILRVSQTISEASENQNFPLETIFHHLNIPPAGDTDLFWVDCVVLLKNIHEIKYIQHINNNMTFSFFRTGECIQGELKYNTLLYEKSMAESLVGHFNYLLEQAIFNVNAIVSHIEVFSPQEKEQLLHEFNDTTASYPKDKTIIQLFEDQVEQTPDRTAVSFPLGLGLVYDELDAEETNHLSFKKIENCCFKKSPYLFQASLELPGEKGYFEILKNYHHNTVVVNLSLLKLLKLFDGKTNIKSLFSFIKNADPEFFILPINSADILEITLDLKGKAGRYHLGKSSDYVHLVKNLYNNHLLDLVGYNPGQTDLNLNTPASELFPISESPGRGLHPHELLTLNSKQAKAHVLLLGDTPGMPSTGLLYLGSYLKRNGIDAFCQFYDPAHDYYSMKENLETLLEKIKPKVVAVSLKWFLYIARVLDICKIVKEYGEKNSIPIKVVVGGNTASYYWEKMIQYVFIDFVIRGDGELPLLKICQEEENIPNCVYRKNQEIIANPVSYVQDETNAADIYLSNLDEILLASHASIPGTFFIYTHKGCPLNCFYCGGCRQAQQASFNRKKVLRRNGKEVRKDIIEAQKYTSTFQFELNNSNENMLNYCKEIWQGIDLSNHFCILNTLLPPSTQLIALAAKTFKYVYWDFDVCTLSQRHREQLVSLNLVKPQPSDEEILTFFQQCESYDNIEIRVNLITGLPYFTLEDITASEKLLEKLMTTYHRFDQLHWARLHAQPGAPVVQGAQLHGMHSYAVTFEDFLEYSEKNFNRYSNYPGLESMYYPYIYFTNSEMNAKITQFYSENNLKIQQHQKSKKRKLTASQDLSFRELNQKAHQWAHLLKAKGLKPGDIAGIMLDPSIEIPIGILAVLKAGGAYLPIDPEIPSKRIYHILLDAQVSLLLTKSSIAEKHSSLDSRPWTVHPNINTAKLHLTGPRSQITWLDDLPFPDRSLVDYEKYNKYIGQALVKNCMSLQATRGCPYHCAYCHKIWPKRNIVRSAENIFTEVRLYYNLGVRRFAFIDDIFNLDIENSKRFFQLIIENQLDLQLFFPNGMRGDLLTKEYIDLMVKVGTVDLALALETASPRLQKLIGKHLNIKKLRENIQYFIEKYPHVILELFTMHGFPTETKEEALQTLDFIKRIKWLHFPIVSILKVYPNTDMEKIALENGVSSEAITASDHLAGHQLPMTLPFEKSFTLKYQAEFFNEYFLSKERLLHVLPYQAQVLSEDEIVQKYNSYLPIDIYSFNDLLDFIGITRKELGVHFLDEKYTFVPNLNEKLKDCFPGKETSEDAFKVLLLDLSQFFSSESNMLYDVVEAPLGLMYILTYLKNRFGNRISGKIAKSRIDFDNYSELKACLEEFKPNVIGIRTLNLYKKFFHKTATMIRHWGFDGPLIAGGPYATSSYKAILQDRMINLVVMGEGEITFSELIGEIMANKGKLPADGALEKIAGIAFIPQKEKLLKEYTLEKIMMNEHMEPVTKGTRRNKAPVYQPDDIIYTIFTSGSSGKPKGVLIKNKNLVNYVNWFSQKNNLTAEDKTILTSSFAFDLGYTSLYPSLLKGCQLHIVPREIYLSAERFLNYLKQNGITYIKVTPALFTTIVNNPYFSAAMCEKLRLVVLGGEEINLKDIEKAHQLVENLQIMNHYGPTEATIGSIATFVNFDRFDEYKKHPVIGKPISNTNVFILDKDSKLLPVGVPGELCIAGTCLAWGYINRPGLTAEKFDHDFWDNRDYQDKRKKIPGKGHMPSDNQAAPHFPIHPLPHSPIYRTGDMARWLPEGSIEFLGRIDQQVKLRGYRIELEEIENQLLMYNKISDAVVVIKENDKGDKYLCSYIVPMAQEKHGPRQQEIALKTGIMDLTDKSLDLYASQQSGEVLKKYDDRCSLSKNEQNRYQRQMLLDGWGIESQEKLKNTTVFVAGAGGGASPTITQLALAGVGTIIICDYDEVELSNLNRQFLHDESRIGMKKALSAKITINKINPHVNVVVYTEKITRENVFKLVGDSAIIFDMLDDLEGKFILSECAVVKQIPHIISAMIELSSFSVVFHPPKTPCFHCLYDKNRFDELNKIKCMVKNYQKKPLHVVASTLFVSTGFAVTEAIKILLGFENPAYNKFFLFNQEGSKCIAHTDGFKMMTHIYSNHFRKISKEQGFDWDEGFRGNFLEELTIRPDENCILCGGKNQDKLFGLRKEINAPAVPNQQRKKNSTSIPAAEKQEQGVDLNSLTRELREHLAKELPGYMVPSHFILLDKMPLTPNGKIDKKALPEPDQLETRDTYIPPRNEIEKKLADIWEEILGVERIGMNENFFEIGLDSIKAIQIASRLQKNGLKVEINDIFLNPTLRELQKFISAADHKISQHIVEGNIQLTPVQQWFFLNILTNPHHFNMAVILYKKEGFAKKLLEKTLSKIVEHHDALRMVYSPVGCKILQHNRGLNRKAFHLETLDLTDKENVKKEIERESNRIQESIELDKGPLLKLGLFKTTTGDHLLMVIHHLVIDGVSWRILLEDFKTGYRLAEKGQEIIFQEKTSSFKSWSEELNEYSKSKSLLKERNYWRNILETNIRSLPCDHKTQTKKRTTKNTKTISIYLEEKQTTLLLKKANRAYNTSINDLLLTALGTALHQWRGIERIFLTLEGHGREEIIKKVNIKRTIGWFTSPYPVLLEIGQSHKISHNIKSIKETLRRIPNKGIGYGILRYLTPEKEKKGIPFTREPEISFNYLGQFGQGKKQETDDIMISPMSTGRNINPENENPFTLSITGIMMGKKLKIFFTFDRSDYEIKSIEHLAQSYQSQLQEIINHCCRKKVKELTPSDFGCTNISLEEFQKIEKYTQISTEKKSEIQSIYPMSPVQKGFLLNALENNAQRTLTILTVNGNIDIALFQKAYDLLVKRYDILRTIFYYQDMKNAWQVVLKERKLKIFFRDISALSVGNKNQCLEEFKRKEWEKGFDFRKGHMRVSMIKTGSRNYKMFWSVHRTIFDGWCVGLVFRDFIRLYISLKENVPIKLEPAAPYQKYIQWMENQDREEWLNYWQQYLDGYQNQAILPNAREQKKPGEFKAGIYKLILDNTLTEGLKREAEAQKVTINTIFQTIWGVILLNYNKTKDIVFGSTVNGRPLEVKGIENMVGVFVNTIPIRICSTGFKTFSQLLTEVHRKSILSKPYEYTPLTEILTLSPLKRKLADSNMIFQNLPMANQIKEMNVQMQREKRGTKTGFGMKIVDFHVQTNFTLNIFIRQSDFDKTEIGFYFNAAIYTLDIIKKVGKYLVDIVKQVVQNSNVPLEKIKN